MTSGGILPGTSPKGLCITALFIGFPGGSDGTESQVQSLGWEDPPEKEMATGSRILAWKIPWVVEATVHGVAESDTTEPLHFTLYFSPFVLIHLALSFLNCMLS